MLNTANLGINTFLIAANSQDQLHFQGIHLNGG